MTAPPSQASFNDEKSKNAMKPKQSRNPNKTAEVEQNQNIAIAMLQNQRKKKRGKYSQKTRDEEIEQTPVMMYSSCPRVSL